MCIELKPDENVLTGRWLLQDKSLVADDASKRIDQLVANHLVKISQTQDGWGTLFRDPNDGRFWELIYPDSGMHGGGPPVLQCMKVEDAKNKYDLAS